MSQPTLPPLKVYRVTTTHGQFKVLASPQQAARLKKTKHSASLGTLPLGAQQGEPPQQDDEYMKRVRKSQPDEDETLKLKSMVRALTHKLRKYRAKVVEQEKTIENLRAELAAATQEPDGISLKAGNESIDRSSPPLELDVTPVCRSLCPLEKRQSALESKPKIQPKELTKKFKLAVKPTKELSDVSDDSNSSRRSSTGSSLPRLREALEAKAKPPTTLDHAIPALELGQIRKPPSGLEGLSPLSKLSQDYLAGAKTTVKHQAALHQSARLEIGRPSWRHSPLLKRPLSPSSSKQKLRLVPLKEAIKAARMRLHHKPDAATKERISSGLSKSLTAKAKLRQRVRSELAHQTGDLS